MSIGISFIALILSYYIVEVAANTAALSSAVITRDIAIAAIVIGGVAFLMVCSICMTAAGMGIFQLLSGNQGHRNANPGSDNNGTVGAVARNPSNIV